MDARERADHRWVEIWQQRENRGSAKLWSVLAYFWWTFWAWWNDATRPEK